ncbi:MAG: choice-of-anchor L domain-containing protein, partial [Deltaproteobacteria bacterium]|nr:choice-of-anchor L domain-containing protein [Deltaproteobacteria bacterium]
ADLLNCGGCGSAGPQPQHLKVWCEAGACHLGDCEPGFFDCDLDPSSGCEQPMECKCTPGEVQPCYEGLLGTENVGACHGGTKTCAMDGMQWGSCEGQVLPAEEKCANGIDDDCNGGIDDIPDLDGDGWTVCDGDCCEQKFQCGSPELVNPGAFEFVGNQVDDDCDPNTPDDQPPPLCSTQVKFKSVTAEDVAKAIDLCQFVPKNPAPKDKKWGVVGAEFRLANGNAPGGQMSNMQNFQAAILQNYGTGGVVPKKGQTMAGISSGRMRDQNDPEYTNPNGGSSFGSSSQPPAAYLAAHGGQLPASFGCKGNCPAGNGANDSVNARIEIRVPTNAQSFSYKFKFFSAEYWTYACTQYNDFYLALLTSKAPNLPKDKNISFDGKGNPVSVNNGFFDVCVPKSCYTCPNGTVELQGTGMQVGNTGGATQWLITKAPIVPGETMVIELMVFDVSDGILDSLTILDDFAWSVTPSEVGTDPTG